MNRRPSRFAIAAALVIVLSALAPAGAAGWTRGPSGPGPRFAHAVASDGTAAVYVFGGSGVGRALGDTWIFDGSDYAAGPAAPAGLGLREDAAAAYDTVRGRLVIFGGETSAGTANDTWELAGGSWIQGPPAPGALVPRREHAAAFHAVLGRMVVFGGRDGGNRFDDTWLYDGTSWTPLGTPPPPALTARSQMAMAYDPARSRVVMFGGRDGNGDRNDTWELAGAGWAPGAAAPPLLLPRRSHQMAFLPGTDAVVLFGGYGGGFFGDTWLYDGAWTQGPAAPAGLTARDEAALVTLGSRVLLMGGEGVVDTYRDDVWSFDGTAWTEVTPSVPSGRIDAAMARDATRIVLFGGEEPWVGGRLRNDTWLYDGASWTRGPAAPAAMVPRKGHGMAYDTARGRAILFGGDAGIAGLRADTWEFDGATWVVGGTTPAGLTPRRDLAVAYDAQSGRVVLFGGEDASGLRNDTWEYVGATWVPGPAAPAGLTPRRRDLAVAYDASPSRQVTLLFGGLDASGPRNDTWEYDGTSWTQGAPAPAGLLPRLGFAMAWDPSSSGVVLFGGWDGTAATYGDLWRHGGSAWSPYGQPPADLTPRRDLAVAYDSAGVMVLFGGVDPARFRDTFELGASPASFLAGPGPGATNGNLVRVFDRAGQQTPVDFTAYGAGGYGTNVASADVDAGELGEILTAPGPGAVYGPQIRAWDDDGSPVAKVNFFAYGTLRYGAHAAGGDVEGDGFDEMLSGAGPGTVFGPHVRGFDYDGTSVRAIAKINFFAYATLAWGARVDRADVEGDLYLEILTAPGPGPNFGPQVRAFQYDGGPLQPTAISFLAFGTPQYGAWVAGGNVDRDGIDELAAAPGPGPTTAFPARFRGFDVSPLPVRALPGFDVVGFPTMYGGRVALADVGGPDVACDLVAGAGADPLALTTVRGYSYDGAALPPLPATFDAFSTLRYGVSVAGGAYGY